MQRLIKSRFFTALQMEKHSFKNKSDCTPLPTETVRTECVYYLSEEWKMNKILKKKRWLIAWCTSSGGNVNYKSPHRSVN
uniref:Uncharacterized protein n=1 Tax=Anguilla anguilla TaxID=7936 RepID=A0A0E9SHC7_ANGAN